MMDGANVIDIADYQEAIDLQEVVADADCALQFHRPDLALRIFDLALKLVPDQPAILFRRAVALTALGRGADAVAACDDAMKVRPADDPQAWMNLQYEGRLLALRSDLLRNIGRLPEAVEDGNRAVSLCPDVAEVLLSYARALACAGRGDDAIDAYEDIVSRSDAIDFSTCICTAAAIAGERDAVLRLLLEGATL